MTSAVRRLAAGSFNQKEHRSIPSLLRKPDRAKCFRVNGQIPDLEKWFSVLCLDRTCLFVEMPNLSKIFFSFCKLFSSMVIFFYFFSVTNTSLWQS